MQARNIIIGLAGVAMVGILVVLLVGVRGGGKAEVSEEQRARALAEYQRRNRIAEVAKPLPDDKLPAPLFDRTRRPRPVVDEEDEKPARRAPRIPERRASRAQVEAAIDSARGEDEAEGDETVAGMTQATRHYDKGDYPAALEAALAVLEDDPRNIKMLRVVVSTKCALNEVDSARSYSKRLPRRDQRQMRTRCKNWGADL